MFLIAQVMAAKGRFDIDTIVPGTYEIGLHYFDMTWEKDQSRPQNATPILCTDIDRRTLRKIEISAGDNAEVTLEVPALGDGFRACSGVALGFDRLMMVALGKDHIRDVHPVPRE